MQLEAQHGANADSCRARVLASALVVETAVGLTYFFPLYSESLKRAYGLSNGSVQLLASLQNVGGAVGIHVGVFYDRFGPRLTVILGLLIGGLGWGGLWLALAYGLPASFAALAVLAFLQGHGQMVADCASVPTVALHFPAEQYAVALGLVKSLTGLSGSLAAQVYAAVFAPPAAMGADLATIDAAVTSFLRVAAFWFAAVCAIGAVGLRRDGPSADPGHSAPPQSPLERARLDGWLGGAYSWMLCLVAILACGALVNEHIRAALVATGVLRELHTEQLSCALAVLALTVFIGHVLRGPPAPSPSSKGSASAGEEDVPAGSAEEEQPRPRGWLLGRCWCRRGEPPTMAAGLLEVERGRSFILALPFASPAARARRRAAASDDACSAGDADLDSSLGDGMGIDVARSEEDLAGVLASEIALNPPVPTSYSIIRPVLSTASAAGPFASGPLPSSPLAVASPRVTPSSSSWRLPSSPPKGEGAPARPSGAVAVCGVAVGCASAEQGGTSRDDGNAPPATDGGPHGQGARNGEETASTAGATATALTRTLREAHPTAASASEEASALAAALQQARAASDSAGDVSGGRSGHLATCAAELSPAAGAPNLSLAQALIATNFWLQFCVEFALAGSGLVITNNLAQVVRALGPPPSSEATGERPPGTSAASLVSLLGVCNCVGRLAVALVAESLARRGMPRSLPFVPACLLMGLAHLLVAQHSRALLAPACALCGIAFGALAALNPVVVSTLYGSRSFGAIYTTIMAASALGSLALSSWLAVAVYARATPEGDLICVGADCFRLTGLTCAGLCAAASVLAATLSWREAQLTRRRAALTRESVAAALRVQHAAE